MRVGFPRAPHAMKERPMRDGTLHEPSQALHVEDLTVSYGDTPALWDIDLDIPPGVMCAIVGPNGAGKPTHAGAAERSRHQVEAAVRARAAPAPDRAVKRLRAAEFSPCAKLAPFLMPRRRRGEWPP